MTCLCIQSSVKNNKTIRTGRLVPTRPTGIEFRVRHGIHVVDEKGQYGKGRGAGHWVKCVLYPEDVHSIPQGSYFLHSDDGKVHQLRFHDGEWEYLAVAA